MKRDMTVRFEVKGETDSGQKHHIYWLSSGELVLADHGDQTFAQFMGTWNLMGQPPGPCACPHFVVAFRGLQRSNTRYCSDFRALEHHARGFVGNAAALAARVETLSTLRTLRGDRRSSQLDPFRNADASRSARRSSVCNRKRARFQRTMAPILENLGTAHDYGWPVISFDWSEEESVLAPVYTEFTMHHTKQANPTLSVRVNVHAWDAMRRGWNRVADPSNNLIMGAKLARHPETSAPVLCFKCIVVTSKPGIQRFRIGYRYMGLVPNATGQLVEDWHPFHDLRAVTDAKNDRY